MSRSRHEWNRNGPQPRASILWTGRDDFDLHLAGASFISSACRLVLSAPGLLGLPERLERYVLQTVKTSVSGMDGAGAAVGGKGGWPRVGVPQLFKAATTVEAKAQSTEHQQEAKEGGANCTANNC